MKVSIVLDGSDISSSLLEYFFKKIYNQHTHEIHLLYAQPKQVNVSETKIHAKTALNKIERTIQHNYLFSQDKIPSSYCVFKKNLVKAVINKFSEETPDAVVFACDESLSLTSILTDFGDFFSASLA